MRIPIRLRLTLVFVVVMAAILSAFGLFIYARLRSEFDSALDQDLANRAVTLTSLVAAADSGVPERDDVRAAGLVSPGHGSRTVVWVLAPSGKALVQLPASVAVPALPAAALAAARTHPALLDARTRGASDPFRLYARSTPSARGRLVAVVGVSLGGRDAALHRLVVALLLDGPAALLLTAVGAYALAAAALRPVELMRRRAMSISTVAVEERLPIPPARDEIGRLSESLNQVLDRLEAALWHERAFALDSPGYKSD